MARRIIEASFRVAWILRSVLLSWMTIPVWAIGKRIRSSAKVIKGFRVSKLNLVIPIVRKEAELTKDAIIQALTPFSDWVHTITFDNGREFCKHSEIANALDCKTYFAKPYHSWERGLNENHNGLLRQYFPKQSPLDKLTQHEADIAVSALNNRPRKPLNYRTHWEVFIRFAAK